MSGPHAGLNPDPAGRLACADCPVGDSAVCAVLSGQEKLALAGIGRHRTLAAGEHLFDAGDDAIACATLISGSLKLSRLDEDGTERLFGIIHPSGFLGRLFSTQTDVTATALTDARLCIFPRGDFEQVLADRPHLMRQILSRTMDALEEMYRRMGPKLRSDLEKLKIRPTQMKELAERFERVGVEGGGGADGGGGDPAFAVEPPLAGSSGSSSGGGGGSVSF